MKAIGYTKAGPIEAPDALIEFEAATPQLGPRDLLVEVKGISVNPVDVKVRSWPQMGPEEGQTKIIGYDAAVFAEVEPILQAMGGKVTHVGDVGAGQVAKNFNQIIVGITIQAVAEAVTMCRKAGVDPAKVRNAVRGGYAESLILDRHGLRMIERDFSAPGHVAITHKDLMQALEFAKSIDLHLPGLEMNEALFRKCLDDGHGKLDHSALIKAIDPEA